MRNTKEIVKAFAPLIIVFLLFVFAGQFAVSKVTEYNQQIKALQNESNTLTEKRGILRTVSESAAEGATSVSLALPDQNPSVVTISQLKLLASRNEIGMLGMKAGSEVKDKSGLKRVDVAFEVDGPKVNIIKFVNDIKTIAPITLVDKIKISELNGSTRANITVKSFWADLPKSIPNVGQQISDLTEKEVETLTEVNNLLPPSFVVTDQTIESQNSDPFNP